MNEKNAEQEKDTNQKQPRSDSQKAMNSIIGGLVFGVSLSFLAYLIYEKIGDFPLGKILTYLSGFLAFICFAVVADKGNGPVFVIVLGLFQPVHDLYA